MYEWFVCMYVYVCAPCMCLVPKEAHAETEVLHGVGVLFPTVSCFTISSAASLKKLFLYY